MAPNHLSYVYLSHFLSLHTLRILVLERYVSLSSLPVHDTDHQKVTHGIYGSLLQCLGAGVGFCGAIPCCPFPNPFRNVSQGLYLLHTDSHRNLYLTVYFAGSVGLVSRFGKFYKSVDPGLVQVNVCTESLRIVDVKIQISPIGRQTVMCVTSFFSIFC